MENINVSKRLAILAIVNTQDVNDSNTSGHETKQTTYLL